MSVLADTQLKRLPERGSQDFELACSIIDEAKICHVGFSVEGQPYVVPMALGRNGKQLLLHGSVASRLLKTLRDGVSCCVTVTHLDGQTWGVPTGNSGSIEGEITLRTYVDDPVYRQGIPDRLYLHPADVGVAAQGTLPARKPNPVFDRKPEKST